MKQNLISNSSKNYNNCINFVYNNTLGMQQKSHLKCTNFNAWLRFRTLKTL